MTVGELVAELQEFDPGSLAGVVVAYGREGEAAPRPITVLEVIGVEGSRVMGEDLGRAVLLTGREL